MAPRPRSHITASPPRPAKRWPLTLFILAVIAVVAATVLLANGQRNFKAFTRFLGIPLPETATVIAPVQPGREQPRLSKPVHRWPWPGFATEPDRIEPMSTPADMCSRQAAGAREIPAFAEAEQRGWECSILQDGFGVNGAASLFLQARGRIHEPADNVRMKFNLAGGALDGDLATHALAFLRSAASMPRDPALFEALAKMLTTQADFYYFAGYQSLTFRQEIGSPGRYNLIGADRTSRLLADQPKIWPAERQGDTSARDARTGRLPPLLTLPAGSD